MHAIQFIEKLKIPQDMVQICYLNSTTTLATHNGKDVYFVGNTKVKHKRCDDTEIDEKYYFAMDYDVRQSAGGDISDSELMEAYEYIRDTLNQDKYLCNYSMIVHSWNWFHVYYVTNKNLAAGVEEYKSYVKYWQEYSDTVFGNKTFYTDKSCCNLARIFRLPGTENTKRVKKFWLEPTKTEVLDQKLAVFPYDDVATLAKRYEDKKSAEYEATCFVKQWSSDNPVYDAINKLDIRDIVCQHFWIQMQKDNKNFKSDKDGNNMGMYVSEDNILVNTGSSRLWSNKPWYNCFSFVKYERWLSDADTFTFFVDNFHEVKKVDDETRGLEQKKIQESSKPSIKDPGEYVIDFWQLLDRAKDYRQQITKDSLCSYWIFDKYFQGILPDDLIVIWADTGVGKSEISYKIAIENTLKNKKVLLFTLEWSLEEIALREIQRSIAKDKEVTTAKYRYNGDLYKEEEENAIKRMSDKVKRNLHIYNKNAKTTMAFLKELITKTKDQYDLFIIDHLHYIHLDTDNENRETWEIMRELKMMTDVMKKPVVLVSHLRKRNRKAQPVPTEYDLHWSSNISKEATTIMLLCREEERPSFVPTIYQKQRYSLTRIICPKNRAWLWRIEFLAVYDLEKKDYLPNMYLDQENSTAKGEDFTF